MHQRRRINEEVEPRSKPLPDAFSCPARTAMATMPGADEATAGQRAICPPPAASTGPNSSMITSDGEGPA